MMARRKITEMTPLKEKGLKGYEAIWGHIISLNNKQFTVFDVEKKTNCHRESVRDYIKRLVRAGYLAEVGMTERKGRLRPIKIYRSIKLPALAPRLRRDGSPVQQGSGQDFMWRTMKMLKSFSAQDLAIHATTDTIKVSTAAAQDYIKHLVKAGYLKIYTKHKGGSFCKDTKTATYCLLPGMNTGPKAPMIQRTKRVFDPNLSEVVWPKGGINE